MIPMKRWILVGFVICALVVAWSMDHRSQQQDTTASVQEQLCYDIIDANGWRFLLNRCTGDSWRFDSGYDSEARDFINEPSWKAMTEQ